MSLHEKIKTFGEFVPIRERLKREGKKLIHCHGLFDLIHPGHILHFKSAKKLGDCLVVSVTPDHFARKGPGRPVFNQRLRLETLAGIGYIDYVILNEWPTAVETLHRIRPDVYVKGQDYASAKDDLTGNITLEMEAARRHGGEVVFTQEETFSSSSLLNKYFINYPAGTNEYLKGFHKKYGSAQIIEWLNGLSDLKVLVVGEAILDEYVYCVPLQKSPKDAIVTTKYDSEEQFAGGAVATANHLAQFCREVTLVTYFGPDPRHKAFLKSKMAPNINLCGIDLEDRPTVLKRRFFDKTWLAKMYEMQCLNDAPLSGEGETKILALLREKAPAHDLAVVMDFGHGLFTPKIRRELTGTDRFLALNVQTNSANFGFNFITKYARANYVSLDELELKLASQVPHEDIGQVARALRSRLEVEHFMVTRGPLGSMFLTGGDGLYETPVFSQKIVDRTGAGDAFFSVTAPCVFKNFPPDVTGFVGNCVGALAVEIVCNREPVDKVSLFKFIQHLLK